ncbi:MAG: flagellar export chaperone FliS [Lachnospiraceae bacterium]|jgi:flagellar protein FliS|nr:flagellar export chaperone FliS [Lachnospiraceae bacterium]MBQ1640450.1 flagellar export chaperone FliS [Lachnospiraceae bacterium]MBQ1721157.1 flagellar export chaperone FliS [Lachnospiraceae bacterium]MBQ2316827.1 flagellar export chaperone FliS [Lachnospiraceae bacterium]MBQ2467282.1 flagellar export chaperone FliS [Lachnospiraceae bacterium]
MISPKNAYAQYNNSKIMTASPAELTLMLYEGAIKFVNIAIVGIENEDNKKKCENIVKADRIIEEFQLTLNDKYEVSKDFNKVYTYIRQRLLEANISSDKEILEEVLKHLRTMRDTWKQVMEQTAGNGTKVS